MPSELGWGEWHITWGIVTQRFPEVFCLNIFTSYIVSERFLELFFRKDISSSLMVSQRFLHLELFLEIFLLHFKVS